MSHEEECRGWIKKIMPNIIETLGLKTDEADYELATSNDIFVSTMYYVTVKSKSKVGSENKEFHMILKRPTHIESTREWFEVEPQFHNEILFYQTYVRPGDNFPRCIYFDEKPPTDTVIVLENVSKKRGYCSCPHSYDAPLEYTLAAMRELGRFHGKGYAMKELQREEFFGIVNRIQEVRYNQESQENNFKIFMNLISPRTIEYLRRQGHDEMFCDQMEALLSDAYDKIMLKTVQPLEPLSTICHGDFTLANTLFKAEGNGKYHGMLIDFALIKYATPVIDISTYLCLNCSNEIRKEKFTEIMRAYHDALKEYLQDAGVWDAEKYSYDAVLENYVQGGLFGFIIASFYLAFLTGHLKITPVQLASLSVVEQATMCKEAGGDEVSKLLAEMLLDLENLGTLKHFL